MAYTALEKMRRVNRKRFGKDIGPFQPPMYVNRKKRSDLKSASLRFIRTRCEGLRFDSAKEEEEEKTGKYLGTSLKKNQIPFNMERDLDRLCLEKALETFIDSGTDVDAYMVYYCFLDIFLGEYGKSKKMIELLSEYEANGSALLMKHRDHYSHSVYVFALGLAVYETSEAFRGIFRRFYGLKEEEENRAANLFLEFWGLTSLFHDIGYPFELPFEQVLSYFEVGRQERGEGCLFPVYRDVETLTGLKREEQDCLAPLYGNRRFETSTELFAFDLASKMGEVYGFTAESLLDVLRDKPEKPDRFGYYMDHAFFSASRLCRELINILGPSGLKTMHVDALTAILLHNSLFKFSIAFYKDEDKSRGPMKAGLHPLAWLLMLCDELQCWDRTAYGRNSRTELHPMGARFDFSGGAIRVIYFYDKGEDAKIRRFEEELQAWKDGGKKGKEPRLKAYSDMAGEGNRFALDIEKIADTSFIPLEVTVSLQVPDRKIKHTYLSTSSFMHLYDFAVTLHARKMPPDTSDEAMENKFTSMSLEYQLSTINRARYFDRYLDAIGCFYTDRQVDYDLVKRFSPRDTEIFAPMEHERWIREHHTMGWRYGRAYEEVPLPGGENEKERRAALREQMRCHKLCMDGVPSSEEIRDHYLHLDKKDQDKDWKPFNRLLILLRKFDGLRIYRL